MLTEHEAGDSICESPHSCFMCSKNLVGIFMSLLLSCLVKTFTFEHQAVMGKKLSLSNLSLLIPLIESSTKAELLMFKAGITK